MLLGLQKQSLEWWILTSRFPEVDVKSTWGYLPMRMSSALQTCFAPQGPHAFQWHHPQLPRRNLTTDFGFVTPYGPKMSLWYTNLSCWWLSPTPLENMKVSWDDEIPNIWKTLFQTRLYFNASAAGQPCLAASNLGARGRQCQLTGQHPTVHRTRLEASLPGQRGNVWGFLGWVLGQFEWENPWKPVV